VPAPRGARSADGAGRRGPAAAISSDYGLNEDALDLRSVFITGRAAAQTRRIGQRPQISIALTGPLDAPRRNVDLSAALISWLALRGVELEGQSASKRPSRKPSAGGRRRRRGRNTGG